MKYHFSIRVLLVMGLIVPLAWFYPVYAKENTQGTSAINISLSPSYTQLLIQPGKSVDLVYELTNWGDPSSFSFHIYQFDSIDEQKIFKEHDQNDITIHFSSPEGTKNDQSFFLNSKKKKKLKITVSANENTPQHDYYYAFVAYNEPVGNTDEKSLIARIKAGLTSTFFITVSQNGNINSEPLINSFTLDGSSYPTFRTTRIFDSFDSIRPEVFIKNDGRNFISSNGILTVKNIFGFSSETSFIPSLILSESTKTIPLTKSTLRFFLPGKYIATAHITIHNPHTKETITTLHSSYQFYVIPGKLMVIFGVLVIMILSWRLYKRKNIQSTI